MRIIFIRHAESEANVGAVSQPNQTISLTARGHQQARALLADIPWEPRAVFVSEYIRTHQTAAPVLARFNLQKTVMAPLNEFNLFGYDVVKGLTGQQRLPLTRRYWRACDPHAVHGEEGQSFNAFCQQVRRVMTLLEQGAIPDGSLLFGHGLWISVFLWLRQNGLTSEITAQQMADFFGFLKQNHPRNCQIFTLQPSVGRGGFI